MWSRERMDAHLCKYNIVVSAANRRWLRSQIRREEAFQKKFRALAERSNRRYTRKENHGHA